MLDADSTSMASTDLVFNSSKRDVPTLPAPAHDPIEAPLTELMVAARKLMAAVHIGPGLSPRARAELNQARHLLEALGAAIDSRDLAIDALMVADDGTWFQTQAGRVDVARRGAVRRILAGLSHARLESPGKALTVDELFGIGWPGERIPYESQVRRVYTAVWTLRTLGLEGLLLTRDEGYLLDPKRTVRMVA
ncbi:MAG: hypothetical protein HOW73_36090 [Polyangiaceae bacterium]|nr:hypothetical protein [Polyangiaceae bacterium]